MASLNHFLFVYCLLLIMFTLDHSNITEINVMIIFTLNIADRHGTHVQMSKYVYQLMLTVVT